MVSVFELPARCISPDMSVSLTAGIDRSVPGSPSFEAFRSFVRGRPCDRRWVHPGTSWASVIGGQVDAGHEGAKRPAPTR